MKKKIFSILLFSIMQLLVLQNIKFNVVNAVSYVDEQNVEYYLLESGVVQAYFSNSDYTREKIVIPEYIELFEKKYEVTDISSSAFIDDDIVKTITLPKSIRFIYDDRVFMNFKGLESISVDSECKNFFSSEGVLFKRSGSDVKLFSYPASKAESKYTVPDYVKSFADFAFVYCTKLHMLEISASVENISLCALRDNSIEHIEVNPNNVRYFSRDGVLFYRSTNGDIDLLKYPSNKPDKKYVVMKDVSMVQVFAFEKCKHLDQISFEFGSCSEVRPYFYNLRMSWEMLNIFDGCNPNLKICRLYENGEIAKSFSFSDYFEDEKNPLVWTLDDEEFILELGLDSDCADSE